MSCKNIKIIQYNIFKVAVFHPSMKIIIKKKINCLNIFIMMDNTEIN